MKHPSFAPPIELEIKLDWSELDLFGHINNVSFFKYSQAARVNLWELSGMMDEFGTNNIAPMLAHSQCDFKRPLFYPGKIMVHTSVKAIGNSSFRLEHQIKNSDDQLAALAEDAVVYYDFNQNKSIPIPDSLRKNLEQLMS